MSLVRNRRIAAVLGAGALATMAIALVPATASAGPLDLAAPLLNSTCSFAQVDAALHDKAPALASILDQNPAQKAELKAKFDQSPAQRQAEFDAYVRDNPDAANSATSDPRAGGIAATIQTVADTCHNY
ncbi:hemophore-related protein [Nocardia sp. SYP-A9097]|uniref:hemophore-related protein n=1 Tax=Nocardia sp. SYP-A9097 TaxID=2663237 RepID=UPI00129B4C38|nr:hemophore-related protein [Nocardia sp. SYP-A9097]MRH91388.1 hemophore-related protein [Nocardia sp. SYP-A9097]